MKLAGPLTPEQQRQIKSRRVHGESIHEIGEALNLQTRAIRNFLGNENVVIEKGNHETNSIPVER